MKAKQWDVYAENYHDYILSPIKDPIKNPLISDLKKLDSSLHVADLGTGRGDLLPLLKRFKKVYAIDFSKKMIENAKKKKSSNVKFYQQDLRKLSKLGINFDVAIAVNSILPPDFKDVDKIFSEIYNSLNNSGIFMGIFPSMEAIIYHFQLVYERELANSKDDEKAIKKTKKMVEESKYDIIKGTYSDDDETQKFFYEFELRRRLHKAGFKKIIFKKVKYPWGEHSGDYDDFHGESEIWDWYVTAKK
ncbi:class I SAM-dependent methyltransferase [Nanoarchaeota archaeon]